MIIYFAGGDTIIYDKIVVKYGAAKLFSFMHERKRIEHFGTPVPLMVDSGAHSWNKLSINKVGHKAMAKLPDIRKHAAAYLAFYERLKQYPYTFIELDCYGDLSMDYLDGMYRTAVAMGGLAKFIRVYHPMADGGTLKLLMKWVEEGQTYIGLGLESMPFMDEIFQRLKTSVRFHCFACTRLDILDRYPFYSVDSSTPLASRMYGGIVKDGRFMSKEKMHRRKDISVVKNDTRRIEESVLSFKKEEKRITALWKARGIEWK